MMLFSSRRLRMPSTAEKLMSLDEFLDWEREQAERHEFDGLAVIAMPGASAGHVRIAGNIAFALKQALRGTGCEAFGSDMKVIANGNVRYPDVSVTCRPIGDDEDRILEPIVVIELVSPSTEQIDRGRKKFDYFATPSVRQYAIVEQDERRIDLYTRAEAGGWINEVISGDAGLKLSSIAVELTLDTIYEDTKLDATLRQAGRRQAGGEPAPAA
jgi:Uma2 family endonuclease